MFRNFIYIAMQYMANRLPHVENRLADSRLIRTLARGVVRFGHSLKFYAEKDAEMLKPGRLMYKVRRLSSEFAQTFKDSKEFFKKR